jgi:inner membrane transporter RhtA
VSTKRDRSIGAGTQIFTEVSINFGSALSGVLIPMVGVVAIVTARQLITAAVLLPFFRPKRATLTARVLWPAIMLGVVLAVMNFTFYESVGRLGLGIAATIEFLGPLSLALAASRRLLDFACAIAAGAGVVLLTGLEGDIDLLGIVFALIAAVCWAAYILLTRRVAMQLPGLDGLSIASVVSLVILLPLALFVVDWSDFTWVVVGLMVAVGILTSALPYSLDTFILRRITPKLYAIITSCGPAIGALFGVLILNESLSPLQVLGIAAVCTAAAVGIVTQRDRPVTELGPAPHTIS